MRIMMTTEGTYPYVRGGVSTWADQLITELHHHHFEVVAVVDNPIYELAYSVPSNATIRPVPLWGLELVDEHLARSRSGRRRRPTTRRAISRRFLPAWEMFVAQLVGTASTDHDALGAAVATLAYLALTLDIRAALRDPDTFEVLMEALEQHPAYADAPLAETLDFARSLYRFLLPLAVEVPEVDVAHTSAAAVCALPAIVAKYRHDVPLVVSEHGVYLRERLLALATDAKVHQALYADLYHAIVSLTYAEASVIAPVCRYNQRWEEELGADPDIIRVIYNGVDPARFSAAPAPSGPPVVGFVGRLDPLKDIETLLEAAAIAARHRPGLQVRVWGPETDPAYAARCYARAARADLADVVTFEGPTSDPASAYAASQVVVSSSISEGFPYGVIEAMLCARPIVATDVGGVAEAPGDDGIVVPPRDPEALAAAIGVAVDEPLAVRQDRGLRLRQRALDLFSAEGCVDAYDDLYDRVTGYRIAQPVIAGRS